MGVLEKCTSQIKSYKSINSIKYEYNLSSFFKYIYSIVRDNYFRIYSTTSNTILEPFGNDKLFRLTTSVAK